MVMATPWEQAMWAAKREAERLAPAWPQCRRLEPMVLRGGEPGIAIDWPPVLTVISADGAEDWLERRAALKAPGGGGSPSPPPPGQDDGHVVPGRQ